MNKKFKRTAFILEILKKKKNYVTFDQFNASLINQTTTATFWTLVNLRPIFGMSFAK